jgi:hypothetical protein
VRILASAAVLAAGALAAGCGGGSDEAAVPASTAAPPTAAATTRGLEPRAYAREVDDLCRDVAERVTELRVQERGAEVEASGLPDREKYRRLADLLAEQLRAIERFNDDVAALGLPTRHADDARRLLEKSDAATAELRSAISRFRAGDPEGASEAMQRYAGLSLQSAAVARDSELGFALCGAGS